MAHVKFTLESRYIRRHELDQLLRRKFGTDYTVEVRAETLPALFIR